MSCVPAFAGKYQRTLDKKSHIWNDDPKPGEEVNWAGGRDQLNLANGPGTLTWYQDEQGPTTRVRFLTENLHFVSKLTGTMLRGRWEGMVELFDANGRTSHARFDNGKLMEAWSDGPAPSQSTASSNPPKAERPEQAANPERPAQATKPPAESRPIVAVVTAKSAPQLPPPPLSKNPEKATTISRVPTEFSIEPKPLAQNSSSLPERSTPVPTTSMLMPPQSPARSGGSLLTDPVVSPSGSAGDLFHSLAAPPSLLQHRASLTPREATKIAEAELDREGLKLSDYPRRQLTYNPDSDSWFVSYEHGAGRESAAGPARFGVTVDDKSGKATSMH